MTLQKLKYAISVADNHSFSAAAKVFYVSQSVLSTAIQELEEELGIKLFIRSNRGTKLTADGEDFLRHAREIVERASELEQRYQHRKYVPTRFAVSTQRLPFATRAFNRFTKQLTWDTYDIAIRECPTHTIISDVASGKSDIGILALHDQYLPILQKTFATYELKFTEIAQMPIYAFLRKGHPLSNQKCVTTTELFQYPFVTYDQEADRSEYTEEIIFHKQSEKTIHVSDRCTKIALVRFTDAFSIGPDLTNSNADAFHRGLGEVIALPVEDLPDLLHIGYIIPKSLSLTETAKLYLQYVLEDVNILRGTSE